MADKKLISIRVGTDYPEKIKVGEPIFIPMIGDISQYDCIEDIASECPQYAVSVTIEHEPIAMGDGSILCVVRKIKECIAIEG